MDKIFVSIFENMINKLFKKSFFLVALQILTLLVFALLILGAFGITNDDKNFVKILRNTNISTLIVWSYWWPLIIVSAILFGRFWCSICPMELITSFFGKIGLRKKPNNLLKSGWIITLFYILILIVGIHTLAIHRIPHVMAIYLLILFFAAIAIGYIWEKRTFCTYVCPIGHLLGLYSLLSFKKLRVKEVKICKNCSSKDCISKNNHYKFVGRSCTSELYPANISDNRDCILCGQCHKSCTRNNIAIQKRKFAADLFTEIKLSWAEISFFIILSGFVVYEILSEWKVTKSFLMAFPDWINQFSGVEGNYKGTVKAFVLFFVFPTFFYTILVLLKKVFAKETFKNSLTQLVIAILPITASMHLLKTIFKTTSRIPYWKFAISDPIGVDSAQQIKQNPDLLNDGFLSILSPYIGTIAILLSAGGIILSLLIVRKQKFNNNYSRIISIIGILIYAGIFLISLTARKFL
mgnify:CR=1 FL=1